VTDIPRITGVLSPVVTPFGKDLAPDPERFVRQCRWLLSQNVGLAVFGTNSEANSLSVEEKIELLDRLVAAGLDPARMMPGTGCCALTDSVRLTAHAMKVGCGGVLMLPPFYYKGVSDDGIHASIAEVVQRVADDRLRIYLYHIPPMAGVAFSLPLIERLLKDFPRIVVGIKDSSGDWNNTQALLDSFPGFEVFPGSETHLLDALRKGGAGCISATANVNVAAISRVIREWQGADADALQDGIARTRGAIQKFPMVAANKAILARVRDDPAWDVVRPPLRPLAAEAKAQLFQALEALQFDFGRRVATV